MGAVNGDHLRRPESGTVTFPITMLEESEYRTDSIAVTTKDDNSSRPFIAIAVLVCGVIGGLIMVISFIFFCKYCFKKRQPLASTMGSPGTKRQEDNISSKNGKQRGSVCAATAAATAGARKGYEVLSGANAVVHPVPADLEAYLQQPAASNNNAPTTPELIITSTALARTSSSKKAELQRKLAKLAEDQLLIVQSELDGAESEYDEDPTLAQVSDSNLASTSVPNQQELFVTVGSKHLERPSSKSPSTSRNVTQDSFLPAGQQADDVRDGFYGRQRSASSVPPRQQDRPVSRRTGASPREFRRGSSDEPVTNTDLSFQRRRYPTVAAGAEFYANEYDRKEGAYPDLPVTSPATHHRPRGHHKSIPSTVVPTTISYEYQQPSSGRHTPHRGHFPRSHQMIIDKTPQQQQTDYSASSSNGQVIEGSSKMYTRDHRNAVSYGAAEQDFSASEKNMYARGHRLAFSFTDTGAERSLPPPPPPPVIRRDLVDGSPDRRSTDVESFSFSSALEYEQVNKFCRECRAVFEAARGANNMTTATSSTSSSDQNKRNGNHIVHFPDQRQVKSLDLIDPNRRAGVKHQRQATSLDTACIACMNDAVNRLALLGGEDAMTVKLREYALFRRSVPVSSPSSTAALKRQLTMIEAAASGDEEAEGELMTLDDAKTEQVKEECKQLWSLRAVLELETGPEVIEGDKFIGMITIDDEYDVGVMGQHSVDTEGETGATTSYTTSFESNTEPITVEDYLRSRPSGPYLAPPRMSVEAKRQKLRSLYARRQLQLQQQGASIESYESVETVDSSSSGRPELLLTSTESNQEQINAYPLDGRVLTTEQQQTSLSFDSSIGGDMDPQTPMAIRPSNGGDYLTPSLAHRRHIYGTGNGRDSAANATETDKSGLSGESFDDNNVIPPPPPPAYPNVHLVRMRRQYETGTSGHRYPPPPPPPQLRDYSVDAKTEAIYREFVRRDPKLDSSSGKRRPARRFQYRYERGGNSYDNDSAASSGGGGGGRSDHHSIDEDHHQHRPSSNRYDIPVIRLPEDDLVSSPQHRQSSHQVGTAMVAKG